MISSSCENTWNSVSSHLYLKDFCSHSVAFVYNQRPRIVFKIIKSIKLLNLVRFVSLIVFTSFIKVESIHRKSLVFLQACLPDKILAQHTVKESMFSWNLYRNSKQVCHASFRLECFLFSRHEQQLLDHCITRK